MSGKQLYEASFFGLRGSCTTSGQLPQVTSLKSEAYNFEKGADLKLAYQTSLDHSSSLLEASSSRLR